jgi:hypothetical protein
LYYAINLIVFCFIEERIKTELRIAYIINQLYYIEEMSYFKVPRLHVSKCEKKKKKENYLISAIKTIVLFLLVMMFCQQGDAAVVQAVEVPANTNPNKYLNGVGYREQEL